MNSYIHERRTKNGKKRVDLADETQKPTQTTEISNDVENIVIEVEEERQFPSAPLPPKPVPTEQPKIKPNKAQKPAAIFITD